MNVRQALDILEIGVHLVQEIESSPSREVAKVRLDSLHELIKKQRRILSKKYHPDITGDDGTKMKMLNEASDILLNLAIKPQRVITGFQMPVMRTTVNIYNGAWFNVKITII